VATVIASFSFHVAHPWWLLAALVAVPAVLLAWKGLEAVGPKRRIIVVAARVVVISLLALLLAEPLLARKHDQVTLIAIMDRSQSVSPQLGDASIKYVNKGLAEMRVAAADDEEPPAGSFIGRAWQYMARKAKDLFGTRSDDRVAIIDTGETAVIEQLASTRATVHERAESLSGDQTNLSEAVQLGMAIAPPDRAVRMLLVSDGNETTGDLRAASRVAAANGIPIDVLPLRYRHTQEVIFSRLVSPPTAESGQTVALRFVLSSTGPARGRIHLAQNGHNININPVPGGEGFDAPVVIEKEGVKAFSISLPVGTQGLHEYEATFIPDDPSQDGIAQNNRATSMTYVSGPGHVLIVDSDGVSGGTIMRTLSAAHIDVQHTSGEAFPSSLAHLLDVDAVVLANVSCGDFSLDQQQMLTDYVKELGGGLVMVGGPQSFGAGGWIGSPVAEVLPVDMDPPQKKQMPKGALVLILHACEMPQGNYWGKEVAYAAVGSLSRLDLVGVMSYNWDGGKLWDYPLQPVGDKTGVMAAIKQMQMGDMPDLASPLQEAYEALSKSDAAQRHIIIITDGDPSGPSDALLAKLREARITVSGVTVFPHSSADDQNIERIARQTGGRPYANIDPNNLPKIFIKEAQTIKKSLIQEEPFTPKIVNPTSEILRGLPSLPPLKGHVLTGPKGGLAETLVLGPDDDPILASWQAGVGRAVAMTAGADSRWAPEWIGWGGFDRFWEQTLRWAAKSRQPADCIVFADVDGRTVTVTVEGVDRKGDFVQFSTVTGRTIGPDMEPKDLALSQTGPGQYRGTFTAGGAGSYLINLRYQKAGSTTWNSVPSVVSVPFAPEFRDLADNTPLLEEVAHETGGRILPTTPEGVDLFSRAGLALPETPLPLTRLMLGLIVALFIIDVACRRLALDVRAIASAAWGRVKRLWPRRTAAQDARLTQLKERTLAVRGQLKGSGPADRPAPAPPHTKTAGAGRRFEVSEDAVAKAELPDSATETPRAAPRPSSTGPAKPAAATPSSQKPAEGSHLDQLLKARRQARKGPGQGEDKQT
jgi:uncharacterized membrane protein